MGIRHSGELVDHLAVCIGAPERHGTDSGLHSEETGIGRRGRNMEWADMEMGRIDMMRCSKSETHYAPALEEVGVEEVCYREKVDGQRAAH